MFAEQYDVNPFAAALDADVLVARWWGRVEDEVRRIMSDDLEA